PPTLAGSYAVAAYLNSTDPNYFGGEVTGTLVINKATPAFSNLSSPAVNVGASTVTVSGRITSGALAPGGDDVAITLNGVTQPVSIAGNGNFTTTFNVQGLAASTYSITYAFQGDAARFRAATTGTRTS